MRIGGEAPGGEPILHFGVEAMCQVGSPPPRIGIEATRLHPDRLQMILDHLLGQAAGRRATPCGISPVVTIRYSATSSLRANATIIVLRVPLRLSCVRAWYHCGQSAVLLEHEEPPRQLNHAAAHPCVAPAGVRAR